MIDVKAKTGLVGFIDILGYSQMLMANDVSDTARIVVDVLSEVPDNVVAGVLEDQGLELRDDLESWPQLVRYFESLVRDELDWLLFSDSILVSLPLRTDRDIFYWGTSVVGSSQVCAFLLRQMFDVGLPLRGGVSFGADYEESVRGMLDQLCVSYLIPKKRDRVETGLMVNWVNLPMRFFGGLLSDLRAYVYASFVAHNKDVVPAVQPKIENTEAFVRKVVENVEPRPWPAMSPRMNEAFQQLGFGRPGDQV